MNTPESEFSLITCDRLFSRIEENLSSFVSNGLLDTEQFYPEIKWMISQLGLAVFEQEDAVVVVKNHSVELPYDFYLLDSAWLCCNSHQVEIDSETQKYWQGKAVFFTVKSIDTLIQNQDCPPPNQTGWSVSACNNNALIESVTLTEYVTGAPNREIRFNHPTLLKLRNNKTVGKICADNCRNLFYSSPNEISINRKNGNYFLSSTLKDPVIFLKYWKYPIDRETNLPLIPDDAIIEKALIAHLTHWLLVKLATNGEVTDIWNLIKYWEQEKAVAVAQAKIFTKYPSFSTLFELSRTTRRRWSSYEVLNSNHY